MAISTVPPVPIRDDDGIVHSAAAYKAKLWDQLVVAGECWLWPGAGSDGYGQVRVGGQRWRTHRLAYVITNGAIPDGTQINHICGNRKCCNPAHLYAGTASDNAHDAVRHGTHNEASKTHCRHGHTFSDENTNISPSGERRCRACNRENQRKRREAA